MQELNIHLFGILKERVGKEKFVIEVEEQIPVRDLRPILEKALEKLSSNFDHNLFKASALSTDEKILKSSDFIKGTKNIYILPPV
ncbi:MAG: hypothetical protein D6780_00545, partial [Candidatus Dadabacteria bacterium]